jgi:hypothetical protein
MKNNEIKSIIKEWKLNLKLKWNQKTNHDVGNIDRKKTSSTYSSWDGKKIFLLLPITGVEKKFSN